MNDELLNRARELLARYKYIAGSPEQQSLDAIAALLAEVERLELAIKRQAAAARQLHSAERALTSADRDAAEKARKATDPAEVNGLRAANELLTNEVERLNGVVKAQHETMMEAIDRTNAAEAKLRALAEAEPVASIVTACNGDESLVWGSHCYGFPLIRRPEAP